jgi:hypothetical protein
VSAADIAAAPFTVRVAGTVTSFRTSRCRHAAPRRGSFLEWSLCSAMVRCGSSCSIAVDAALRAWSTVVSLLFIEARRPETGRLGFAYSAVDTDVRHRATGNEEILRCQSRQPNSWNKFSQKFGPIAMSSSLSRAPLYLTNRGGGAISLDVAFPSQRSRQSQPAYRFARSSNRAARIGNAVSVCGDMRYDRFEHAQ